MASKHIANRLNVVSALEPVVFIVNNDEPMRAWIESTVIAAGLTAFGFGTAAEFLRYFTAQRAACVILDIDLPDTNALQVQGDLAQAGAAILFLTRKRCISSCVSAIKAGAVDFLTMPCDTTQLERALRYAVREARFLWDQRLQFGELRSKYDLLTSREREIFVLVSSGLLNKQIAQQLSISEITVQIDRSRVMRKMSARTFASLVRMADALQPPRPENFAHL